MRLSLCSFADLADAVGQAVSSDTGGYTLKWQTDSHWCGMTRGYGVKPIIDPRGNKNCCSSKSYDS